MIGRGGQKALLIGGAVGFFAISYHFIIKGAKDKNLSITRDGKSQSS